MQQRWMSAERVEGSINAYISFASVLIDMTDHACNAIRQNDVCLIYQHRMAVKPEFGNN